MRRDPAWTAVMVAAFAVLGLFLVWPLAKMFTNSLGGYGTFFSNRAYRDSLWNTLILGVAVTATSMIIGGALAVLVARCKFRFAGWVAALPLVTLVIPATATLNNTSGTGSLTVALTHDVATPSNTQLSGTLGTTGTNTFHVGGSIPIADTTASGSYSGSFSVTATYN